MKELLQVKPNRNGNTHIKVELRYHKGGMSFATYGYEERGYYLHVYPVKIEQVHGYTMESFTAFTGYKQLVHMVNRRGAKAEREAEKYAKEVLPEMITRVLAEGCMELENDYVEK